ncbi:MAG: hypothetical protein LLF97_08635 [Planctomycetaceae bacterium]|nr:hypothetical protein [Planctomycetaceae bacterium]
MDLFLAILISSLLLLVAAVLIVSHVRAWRAFQREPSEAEERDYRWRQFRRRMQTSAMVALLAVAVLVGYGIPPGLVALAFWLGVMLLVCWLALLAAVDIWATKHYFGRLTHETLVHKLRLEAELRRLQATEGNGKSHKKNPYGDA